MKERSIHILGKLLLVAIVFGVLTTSTAYAKQSADARIDRLEVQLKTLQAELAALKAERVRDAKKPAVDQKELEELKRLLKIAKKTK